LRPAVENAAGGVTQKRYVYGTKSECPSPAPMVAEVLPKRRCVRMKVLIGVDPHKASIAVAVVDEAKGQLLERASFSQDLEKALGPLNAGLNGSPSVVGWWRMPAAWVGIWR
jgi:hypothetical protein